MEYHVGCLSRPGREDPYENPIPIPLDRFQSSGLNSVQRLENAFPGPSRKGPSMVIPSDWAREVRNL